MSDRGLLTVLLRAPEGLWLAADVNSLRLESNDDQGRRRRHIRRSTNRVHIYPGPAFSLGFTYISGPPKAGWSFRLRINQEQIGFSFFLAGHVTVSTTRAWLFCTINSTSIFLQRQISPYRPLYDSPSRHSRPLDRAEVFSLRFFCPGAALPFDLIFLFRPPFDRLCGNYPGPRRSGGQICMFSASIPNTNIPWMDGKLRQQEGFTLWDCASLCLFSQKRLSCSDAFGKD